MPRYQRNDEPGAWHHVMNRGLARRTMFETDHDIRKFQSLLARAVRAGHFEIHAFCVLSTHFHLLVRSSTGDLSAGMQWVQNQYSRWFNRGRRRDGPLLRGRFVSKRVRSLTYRRHLVRYIDFNAVEAGLASSPALYPHGSACRYARPRGPLWLDRSWVECDISDRRPVAQVGAAGYAHLYGETLSPGLLRWIQRRTTFPHNAPDPLDELLAAAPPAVLDWMRCKAKLADGTQVGYPLCDEEAVDTVVRLEEDRVGVWSIALERGTTSAWLTLRVGLLRSLSAATLEVIASRTGLSVSGSRLSVRRHAALIEEDSRYAASAVVLASRALSRCHAGVRDVGSETRP